MKLIDRTIDRIACLVGAWALTRLYGSDCETSVKEDFPDQPELWDNCLSCDATRIRKNMQEPW